MSNIRGKGTSPTEANRRDSFDEPLSISTPSEALSQQERENYAIYKPIYEAFNEQKGFNHNGELKNVLIKLDAVPKNLPEEEYKTALKLKFADIFMDAYIKERTKKTLLRNIFSGTGTDLGNGLANALSEIVKRIPEDENIFIYQVQGKKSDDIVAKIFAAASDQFIAPTLLNKLYSNITNSLQAVVNSTPDSQAYKDSKKIFVNSSKVLDRLGYYPQATWDNLLTQKLGDNGEFLKSKHLCKGENATLSYFDSLSTNRSAKEVNNIVMKDIQASIEEKSAASFKRK